ncbi:PRC-barrel domain containing protein [Streptomyces sp. NPDC057280]|uniref:PRC-barrel domain containing protein n=1 Tax=Streptomyces sp. NPDC057280 TaxID=3346081 RepID=UPI003638B32E
MTDDLSAGPTPCPRGEQEVPAGRLRGADLVGYAVEATDGSVGRVDAVSTEAGPEHVVVATRDVLLSKKVLLPLAAVTRIDEEAQLLHVGYDTERIKGAPRFDGDMRVTDPSFRALIDEHYGLPGTA